MKKISAFIAAALAVSILTSCGDTDTAEMTSAKSTVSEATTATISEMDTTTAESMSETTAENTAATDTTVAEEPVSEEVSVPAPDAAFLLELSNKWLSEETLENGKSFALDGSPTGRVTGLYTDIDGDTASEFCFILAGYGKSLLYVCDYQNDCWEVADILTIADQYTYLQKTGDNAASLLSVIGVRSVEGLRSYTYVNGVEEKFELFDYDAFYANELEMAENDNDRDTIYHNAIKEALAGYDSLTSIYDLPCAAADVSEVRFLDSDFKPDDFDAEAVQAQFDTFVADVAELF